MSTPSRVTTCFERLRERHEAALVPFVTAGDPDLATTEALIYAMVEAGADLIELGVPHSDPIAEGPTIQRSSERSLAAGTTLRRILDLVARVRERVDIPLVMMGYANNFLTFGAQAFASAARAAGVDAVIVVDLPPEEGAEFFGECRRAGIDPVLLAAPTTTPERLARLARDTCGFLYYVSLTGVTGARTELATGVEESVGRARSHGGVPVCVGFGISTPDQAAAVGRYADGVVVGSAIVDRIESARSSDEAVESVGAFVRDLKAALRRA